MSTKYKSYGFWQAMGPFIFGTNYSYDEMKNNYPP